MTYELKSERDGTLLTGTHEGFDQTHGFMAGLIIRTILKFGWWDMFKKRIPKVLSNIRKGEPGAPISGGSHEIGFAKYK
jgi:hypothetical protein